MKALLIVPLVAAVFLLNGYADPITFGFSGEITQGTVFANPSNFPFIPSGTPFSGDLTIDNPTSAIFNNVYLQSAPFHVSLANYQLTGNTATQAPLSLSVNDVDQTLFLSAGIYIRSADGSILPTNTGSNFRFTFAPNTFSATNFVLPDLSTAIVANFFWLSPNGDVTGRITSIASVPEPSSLVLLVLGFAALLVVKTGRTERSQSKKSV
jgi:hypothetical protein